MSTAAAKPRSARSGDGPVRSQNPDGTKRNIIEVASREFAEHGLSGARIDEIAAKTKSSKRMIYYYFGDKEGLYVRVLETAYSRMRADEAALHLADLAPLAALRRLVEFTFDHHNDNEDFIRLVMIENIHHGAYLARSRAIQELNVTAIGTIAALYERGIRSGVFRKGLDPVELHWQISALCFFNVSNRATFSKIFGRDLGTKKSLARLRAHTVEMIERFVSRP
jgi:AcrR family transcriptional regulator